MTSRRTFIAAIVVGLAFAVTRAVPLYAAEPMVSGLWEQTDDNGKVGGWFLFFERNGMFHGALVRAFPKPGEPQYDTCTKCKDDQKNAPMMGLIIVKDMQRRGLTYENGTILDPRDGSIYKAKLELSSDGQRLTVRGFLGIELFGQSQVWKRLPDNALPKNEIPESVRPYITAATPQALPAKATTGSIPHAGTTGSIPRNSANVPAPRPGPAAAR
ncbi:MAG: DUF2147 domain-containing protein [Xanthobacteraceae bacterium]